MLNFKIKAKDKRLHNILDLQSKYLNALNDAVSWLDFLELKIFSTSLVRTCEEQLMDHEVLFKEMNSFQTEIEILNRACSEIMLEVENAPPKEKVDEMMTELKEKVGELEGIIVKKDAKAQKESELRKKHRQGVQELFGEVEVLREQVLESVRREDLLLDERRLQLNEHQKNYKDLEEKFARTIADSREIGSYRDQLSFDADSNSLAILEKLLDDVKYFILQLTSRILNHEDLKVSR